MAAGGATAAHPDRAQPDLARERGKLCAVARRAHGVVRLPAEKLAVFARGEVVRHGETACGHLLALAPKETGEAATGPHVVSRLVGVLLAALAVQFICDGSAPPVSCREPANLAGLASGIRLARANPATS